MVTVRRAVARGNSLTKDAVKLRGEETPHKWKRYLHLSHPGDVSVVELQALVKERDKG